MDTFFLPHQVGESTFPKLVHLHLAYYSSGWQLIRISPANQLMLQNLGLLPKPEQEEKRRPGRPKNQYSLTNWENIN